MKCRYCYLVDYSFRFCYLIGSNYYCWIVISIAATKENWVQRTTIIIVYRLISVFIADFVAKIITFLVVMVIAISFVIVILSFVLLVIKRIVLIPFSIHFISSISILSIFHSILSMHSIIVLILAYLIPPIHLISSFLKSLTFIVHFLPCTFPSPSFYLIFTSSVARSLPY